MERHQKDDCKPYMNKDGQGWRRLSRITNEELKNAQFVT